MLLCISFFFFGFSQKETSDLSDTPFTFALNENLYFLFSSRSVVFVVFVVAVELRLHLADSSYHYLRTERCSVCGCACARSQKPFVQVSNKFHFSFRGNKSSTTITTIKRLMSRDIQLEPMTTDMLLHRYASSTDPARSTLGADSIKWNFFGSWVHWLWFPNNSGEFLSSAGDVVGAFIKKHY